MNIITVYFGVVVLVVISLRIRVGKIWAVIFIENFNWSSNRSNIESRFHGLVWSVRCAARGNSDALLDQWLLFMIFNSYFGLSYNAWNLRLAATTWPAFFLLLLLKISCMKSNEKETISLLWALYVQSFSTLELKRSFCHHSIGRDFKKATHKIRMVYGMDKLLCDRRARQVAIAN